MVELDNVTEVESTTNIDVTVNSPTIVEKEQDSLDIRIEPKEYVITGDDIFVSTNYNDAPTWLKTLVNVSIDTQLVDELGNVTNDVDSRLNLFATTYVPQNQFTSSINQINTEASNLLSRVNTLDSTYSTAFSDTNARILGIETTYVTENSANAIVEDFISASLLDNTSDLGAEILRVDNAIVQGDQSNANSITVLESTLEGIDSEIEANATAVQTINTYVGITEGTPEGTSLLADIQTLQKQNDGIVETYSNTYDVVNGTNDLIVTAEPYASWIATDTANGSEDVRLSKIGDVYIKYNSTVDGTKEYIASYKFIKTEVDSVSPDKTDAQGFTWAIITDNAAQDAYTEALNAYALADGKVTTFYLPSNTPPTAEGEGDIWIVSDLENRQRRWNGTSWVNIRDGAITANASAITQLDTELSNGTNTWASADSILENSLTTKIENDTAEVESKFAYDSTLVINGVAYNSGFGIKSNGTTGTNIDVGGINYPLYNSKFWVKADEFEVTSASDVGYKPFSISGSDIVFNGKVSFSNVTGYTPPDISGEININNDILAQKLGYANYAEMVVAATSGNTVIDSGYINTQLINTKGINSNQINTTGLIADNINSTSTITGNKIVGANIIGAVITASYLDLDGELEILTNFYLVVGGDFTDVPALAISEGRYRAYSTSDIDAIPVKTGYRIPSITSVSEQAQLVNVSSSATLNGIIHSQSMTTAGNSMKAKLRQPTVFIDSPVTLLDINYRDTVFTGDAGSSNNSITFDASYPVLTNNNITITISIAGISSSIVFNTGSEGDLSTNPTVDKGNFTVNNIPINVSFSTGAYSFSYGGGDGGGTFTMYSPRLLLTIPTGAYVLGNPWNNNNPLISISISGVVDNGYRSVGNTSGTAFTTKYIAIGTGIRINNLLG